MSVGLQRSVTPDMCLFFWSFFVTGKRLFAIAGANATARREQISNAATQ
jgi:hypothetical protein